MHTYIHRCCVDVCAEFYGIIEYRSPSWTRTNAKKPELERWAITLSRFVHKYFFPIHETRPAFPLSLSICRPAGGSELIKPKQAAPRIHADTTRRFIGFRAKTTRPADIKMPWNIHTVPGRARAIIIWFDHTHTACRRCRFFLALGARNCGFRVTHTHESMRYMRAVIYSPGARPSLHQRSCVHRNAKIN